MHNSRLGGGVEGEGIAFWIEDIKVLERMKKEPWVCKLWLPLPAPLGRVCYIETGWDGKGVWSHGLGLQSCHLNPKLGWRKQIKGNEGTPQSPTFQ